MVRLQPVPRFLRVSRLALRVKVAAMSYYTEETNPYRVEASLVSGTRFRSELLVRQNE